MIEIKFLADCKEHIPYLAKLRYEQISKHWAPNASIECANQNLIKHANHNQLPLTLVALENKQPIGMTSSSCVSPARFILTHFFVNAFNNRSGNNLQT